MSSFKHISRSWDDFWAYFWRITHRHGIPGIFAWDRKLIDFTLHVLNLQPDMRVLDVPCGGGDQAWLLASRGVSVVGVDIAPPLIEFASKQAKEKGVAGDCTFCVGDMRKLLALPIEAGSFDALVCYSGSFGYFDEETNIQVLADFARSLKPGGKLLMDPYVPKLPTQNSEQKSWTAMDDGFYLSHTRYDAATQTHHGSGILITPTGEVIHCEGEDADGFFEHIRYYDLEESRQLFASAGLELIGSYDGIDLPPRESMGRPGEDMIIVGVKA